ncbi:MAG: tetratricopeptide repeat protein, partial [Gemmatimonadales bacterium]|nr:tetratricopeptide repeat protein [Gemmatimonadales bacterium]
MRQAVLVLGTAAVLGMAAPQAEAQAFRAPDCDLKAGHFLVNSGIVYIKGASEEGDLVKKERLLSDAQRNLIDAIDRGQQDNPAVWYFLGRYYVMRNDPLGADSVFTRAAAMAPDCAEDINGYRQALWVPTINGAIESMQSGDFQTAKGQLRAAWAVYKEDNITPFYLGQIYGNDGELDSATYFFQQVIDIGTADSSRIDNYNTSILNLGLIAMMQDQWENAVVWFDRYRAEVDPDDAQALTSLAVAVAQLGDTVRAILLYDTVLARASSMGALDLIQTGTALFQASRYQQAVEAFKLALEKNPYYRPALYNLVNSYLAVYNDVEQDDAEKLATAEAMEEAAVRLVRVEPHSADAMRLLAASYQLQQEDDSTLAVLERIDRMTWDLNLDVMQELNGVFRIQGRVVSLG